MRGLFWYCCDFTAGRPCEKCCCIAPVHAVTIPGAQKQLVQNILVLALDDDAPTVARFSNNGKITFSP
jgi:hypothetical protein